MPVNQAALDLCSLGSYIKWISIYLSHQNHIFWKYPSWQCKDKLYIWKTVKMSIVREDIYWRKKVWKNEW
jgi:hypothetical protein